MPSNQSLPLNPVQIAYRHEIYRKIIHLSSLWMPFVIYRLDRQTSLILFTILFVFMISTELGRRYCKWFDQLFNRLFGAMLRQEEANKKSYLTGASQMVLGALVCILFFSRTIAVTSLCILLVSDTMAALIGRRWGRHPLLDKSVEGSVSFFVTSLIVVSVLAIILDIERSFYIAGAMGSMVGTIVELYSKKLHVDDNLLIPLGVGAAMTLAGMLPISTLFTI